MKDQKQHQHRHFLLHKPYGVLSQFIYEGKRKNRKRKLGELYDFPEGTMAIGRLDEDSEGLLFMTTDGMMSQLVRSSKVEKEYYAQVDGLITQRAVSDLQNGVWIGQKGGKYKTKPCEARLLDEPSSLNIEKRHVRDDRHGPKSWVSITVREGKFRQVRKMTAAVGYPTLRLIRVRIGKTKLKIGFGEVEEVTEFEL